MKPWVDAHWELPVDAPDYRFVGASPVCLCGGDLMLAVVKFDGRKPSMWFTDVRCLNPQCGALLTSPTPIDISEDEVSSVD